MSWKQAVSLFVSALALALLVYGLVFAKPRWIDVKVERVGSVQIG